MKKELTQYVELLFAGAPGTEEIRQEILQNTLDRYDDLIASGKAPEAAYRLAISGIGDINEILGKTPESDAPPATAATADSEAAHRDRKIRAIAIAIYILCPIPLLILTELGYSTLGLCLTLGLVAAATYALVLAGKSATGDKDEEEIIPAGPFAEKKKRIANVLRTGALVVFLVVSFFTGAWYVTWLIFPIAACVRGLIFAILDLKEVTQNEN